MLGFCPAFLLRDVIAMPSCMLEELDNVLEELDSPPGLDFTRVSAFTKVI